MQVMVEESQPRPLYLPLPLPLMRPYPGMEEKEEERCEGHC
jgi:hypothetical protein